MNIERTTTTADSAEVRQMISSWTDSLLRLRSRPTKAPPRGEWQFAAAPALAAPRHGQHPQPRFSTDAVEFRPTSRAA